MFLAWVQLPIGHTSGRISMSLQLFSIMSYVDLFWSSVIYLWIFVIYFGTIILNLISGAKINTNERSHVKVTFQITKVLQKQPTWSVWTHWTALPLQHVGSWVHFARVATKVRTATSAGPSMLQSSRTSRNLIAQEHSLQIHTTPRLLIKKNPKIQTLHEINLILIPIYWVCGL